MKRRDFLKLLGISTAAVATGAAVLPEINSIPSVTAKGLGGVTYALDQFPMRFVYEGGKFIHVNPITQRGKYMMPNPAYLNAEYEAVYLPELRALQLKKRPYEIFLS